MPFPLSPIHNLSFTLSRKIARAQCVYFFPTIKTMLCWPKEKKRIFRTHISEINLLALYLYCRFPVDCYLVLHTYYTIAKKCFPSFLPIIYYMIKMRVQSVVLWANMYLFRHLTFKAFLWIWLLYICWIFYCIYTMFIWNK